MDKSAYRMFLLCLVIGIVIYLERPILPEMLSSHSIELQWSGTLFGVFGFAVMLFAPFLGDIGDIKGRRMVFVISVL